MELVSETQSFLKVLAGLTLLCVTCALSPTGGDSQPTRLFNNGTVVCPEGWHLATVSSNLSSQGQQKLCLRVEEQVLSWERARLECRKSKGFLVKLDTSLIINKMMLAEYLKLRGLHTVWTGMHHEHGTLLWDELHPHMVRPSYMLGDKNGWNEGGWRFDNKSFEQTGETCGRLQIQDTESFEVSEDQSNHRKKRSLSTNIGNRRVGGTLPGGQHFRTDNEDITSNRSPSEERSFSTSQAIQEGSTDNVGDAHGTGDIGTGSKTARTTQPSLRTSTASAITTTDQSNVEDYDDVPAVTKRSSPQINTTFTVSTSEQLNLTYTTSTTDKFGGNHTMNSTPAPQKSLMNSSLLTVTTSQTMTSTQSSTSNDDLVNQFLQSSLDAVSDMGSSISDMGGSVDGVASGGSILDDSSVHGNGNPEQTKTPLSVVDSSNSSEAQMSRQDNSDDMLPSLASNSTSLPISGLFNKILTGVVGVISAPFTFNQNKNTTTSPRAYNISAMASSILSQENVLLSSSDDDPTARTNFDSLATASSLTEQNSTDSATEAPNSVLDSDDSQSKDSRKSDEQISSVVTPKSVVGQLKSLINNLFSGSSQSSTLAPMTVEDSQNLDDQSQSSTTAKSVTDRLAELIEKNVFKSSSTNIPKITTTYMSTSAVGITTNELILTVSTKTDVPTLTVSTTTDVPTLPVGTTTAVPILPVGTTTDVPILAVSTTTDEPTLPVGSTTGVSTLPVSIATDEPTLEISTTTDMPTLTVGTTTDMPTLPVGSTTDVPTLTFGTTTDIPTLTVGTTSDVPTLPVGTTTAVPILPVGTTTGVPTLPVSRETDEPTLAISTTTDVPTFTIDTIKGVPTSTVETTQLSQSAHNLAITSSYITTAFPSTNEEYVSTKRESISITEPVSSNNTKTPYSTIINASSADSATDILTSLTKVAATTNSRTPSNYAINNTTKANSIQIAVIPPATTTTTVYGNISGDDVDSSSTLVAHSSMLISGVTSDASYLSNTTDGKATITRPVPLQVLSTSSQSSNPERVDKVSGVINHTFLNTNSENTAVTANFDSPEKSDEKSTRNDSKEEDDLDENSDQQSSLTTIISLDHCQDEHASVCIIEAVEELTLVGHCDRNWYGHRLLDRCYKPVEFLLKAIEARQSCLQYSASLATIDTSFYGNITAMMLSYFMPGSSVWVDVSLNLDMPGDSHCAALRDGRILQVDCNSRLSFICQKDAHVHVSFDEEMNDGKAAAIFVQNLTSFHPQTLWCPLRMSAFDDVILWFKDGRPIIDQDDLTSFNHRNGQLPNRLDINLSILERVGEGGARIPKPAMLQGQYWCEIWRREPFSRVVSKKIILKFTDVITLHGNISTKPAGHVTAAIFNRMGHMTGLPELMERRLATINKNITHFMRSMFPVVRDIISFIRSTNPVTGRSEFTTYISLATSDLTPALRANLFDLYLSALYQGLDISQNMFWSEWNLTLPVRQSVAVKMADICPEANLMDNNSGLSATFPSTPYNSRAASLDTCNTVPIGNALCQGDLQTGAYWSTWRVNPCLNSGQLVPLDVVSGSNGLQSDQNYGDRNTSTDDESDHGSRNPTLWQLKDVHVHTDNVEDVANLLADVCEQTDELSAADIQDLVHIVDRIVSVPKLPEQISKQLIRTANKVLDAPEVELRRAERHNHAPSRLLANLEVFGLRVDTNTDPHLRVVTPNVAMELWNFENSDNVVIGFGATQSPSWSTPLSEPRIQIITDRLWAEQHLSTFDVAVELPESLVRNTVRFAKSPLRLVMFIYRKIGLFLEDDGSKLSRGSVNSAVISASLGGRKIVGLEDKVRLVFKPFQESTARDKSTRCVFWDTQSQKQATWSDYGCSYNGTINSRDVCLCNHLTNFAILTDFYGDELLVSSENETALTVLTIVGLILSIIGLAVTIVTFLAFKKLRQGRAQQTLFNMALALMCFQVTFLVGIRQTSLMPVCLTVSVLLHYFILVSFAWMLIEAVLQYLTFVKVLGTYVSRYTLKTVVPAWGLPVLPVIAVLGTDYRLYLGRVQYCWMNLQAFYYAFALPVGIIIVFNIVMFVVIIISITTRPKGLRSSRTDSNRTRATSLKAAITIFVLLGLTWMFGYLAIEDARLPFQYAFTILSSLQGFLIFVLMVARRRQVREQWHIMFRKQLKSKRNKQKKLSPTFSNSTTCSNSNHSLPSFTNNTYSSDSFKLSSPLGLQRQASLDV